MSRCGLKNPSEKYVFLTKLHRVGIFFSKRVIRGRDSFKVAQGVHLARAIQVTNNRIRLALEVGAYHPVLGFCNNFCSKLNFSKKKHFSRS